MIGTKFARNLLGFSRGRQMKAELIRTGTVAILAGALLLPAVHAKADTVTTSSPGWVLLPNSVGPDTGTWGLPANLTAIGCGAENETTCEPPGVFTFDHPIATINGAPAAPTIFTILDQPGDPFPSPNGISDYVFVDNSAGANGKISLYSSFTGFVPPARRASPLAAFCARRALFKGAASGRSA
jgi:hypothetical protein